MNRHAAVYPYKRVPHTNDAELRYSLRSLANLPHNGDVWIVGDLPDWIDNIRHIPGNPHNDKPRNVFANILTACEHPDTPDEFWIMNDDFMIMRPTIPDIQWRCTLMDHLVGLHANYKPGREWWRQSLLNTYDWLRARDPYPWPILSYELHKPMLINKHLMAHALRTCAAHSPTNPPQWRTVYGNMHRIGGRQATDCKVYGHTAGYQDWPLISTNSVSFTEHGAGQLIRDTFTERSKYERMLFPELSGPLPDPQPVLHPRTG